MYHLWASEAGDSRCLQDAFLFLRLLSWSRSEQLNRSDLPKGAVALSPAIVLDYISALKKVFGGSVRGLSLLFLVQVDRDSLM